MKIVYSVGRHPGAEHQLVDFLANTKNHVIKIAGYLDSTSNIRYVDWTLNSLDGPSDKNELVKIFGNSRFPSVSHQIVKILFDEIEQFSPDLIISDCEQIVAHIANALNIRLWYSSAIHLLDSIEWKSGQLYNSFKIAEGRRMLSRMPIAERVFVYSPFGDLEHPPELKNGFEWMTPYYTYVDVTDSKHIHLIMNDQNRILDVGKILENLPEPTVVLTNTNDINYKKSLASCQWVMSSGNTKFISDALYNKKPLCISPNVSDLEELLNAAFCDSNKLGKDIGQIELMERFGPDHIEKAFQNKTNIFNLNKNGKKFHDRINEL